MFDILSCGERKCLEAICGEILSDVPKTTHTHTHTYIYWRKIKLQRTECVSTYSRLNVLVLLQNYSTRLHIKIKTGIGSKIKRASTTLRHHMNALYILYSLKRSPVLSHAHNTMHWNDFYYVTRGLEILKTICSMEMFGKWQRLTNCSSDWLPVTVSKLPFWLLLTQSFIIFLSIIIICAFLVTVSNLWFIFSFYEMFDILNFCGWRKV